MMIHGAAEAAKCGIERRSVMGSGIWRVDTFRSYSSRMGRTVGADGKVAGNLSNQEMFAARKLDPMLDPKDVVRECCDTQEHPETIPVILALDVTGSMGQAAVEVAKELNVIMTRLYQQVKDVEFMVMGIGDLAYDRAPIQISQFESDIRIAEHLDRIWFERGGGGNSFESYTAAWYMGLNHTSLDCHKRGKKGVIITLGDEPLNPYLPGDRLAKVTGDVLQGDVETVELYRSAKEKFDIFHVAINDPGDCYKRYAIAIRQSFGRILGKRLKVSTLDELPKTILECLEDVGVDRANAAAGGTDAETVKTENNGRGGLFGLFNGLGTVNW